MTIFLACMSLAVSAFHLILHIGITKGWIVICDGYGKSWLEINFPARKL